MTMRERICEALQACGQNNEVCFIDSGEFSLDTDNALYSDRGVRIIGRKTTVTNQIPLMRFVS